MITYFDTSITAFAALDKRSRALDGDYILCPPSENYGYQSTPRNGLTFALMGVDGVHFAILKIDGTVRDDSPVVEISPMDSDDVFVLAESFLSFLSEACNVSAEEMQKVFEAERAGQCVLVTFLSDHFDRTRLVTEQRTRDLTAKYGPLIQRKVEHT